MSAQSHAVNVNVSEEEPIRSIRFLNPEVALVHATGGTLMTPRSTQPKRHSI
jgi:hypothetical protein